MNNSAQPLVSFDSLEISVSVNEQTSTLVHDLTLDIYPGEIVGLVGESGSGKSISALSILQLLPMPPMHYPNGQIRFCGEDVLTAKRNRLNELRGGEVGCVFQEPMTSLNPLHTIEKQLAESLYLHRGFSKETSRAHVLSWLNKVELREPKKKLSAYPHQLSGGERQRVMIAMALMNEPKLLIADEPTTALDVTVQAQILELIKNLQQELGMAVLFISHDLGVVKSLADRVAVMQEGKLVEVGASDEVFATPKHDYTKKLIAAEPSGHPVATKQADELIARAENVRVWFPIQKGVLRRTVDHIKAVDDVSFELRRGKTLGIVGESGSGKSTLAKAILGLEKHTGLIEFSGQTLGELDKKSWRPVRRRMQVVFQDPYGSLSPRMTVAQIIAEGLEINQLGDANERDDKVVDMMQKVDLNPDFRFRYPNEFSGGQRQRIAIARAMILQPELVVLDEPTSSLDRTVQFQILALLKKLQQENGISYLFISHDLKVVKSLAHDVLVMKQGKVVEAGAQIFDSPKDDYTQRLVETAFAYN